MSLNKALIILFCYLSLLLVVTIINLNRSKSTPSITHEYVYDEALIVNILYVPEIIRSYEKVKLEYGKKNILFFRYISNSCNSCSDSQLNELFTFQEEIGKEHVWIFPAYPDDRNSRIRLSAELSGYNYRNIPADSLIIPIYGGEQKSYFAWINSEGEIELVFVPNRSNVYHTRQFFIEVKRIIQMLEENS